MLGGLPRPRDKRQLVRFGRLSPFVTPQTVTEGGCASAIKERPGTDLSQPYALTTGAIEYDPKGIAHSLPL